MASLAVPASILHASENGIPAFLFFSKVFMHDSMSAIRCRASKMAAPSHFLIVFYMMFIKYFTLDMISYIS